MKKKKQPNLEDLTVLADNLMVRPIKPEKETASGLIAPAQYEDKAYVGKVVRVGIAVKEIKIGHTVYFNKYSTIIFPFGEEEFLVLKAEDVTAYY